MNLLQIAFDWLDGQTSPALTSDKTHGQRQILLNNQPINYHFERSKRRTIGFMVGKHGLTVRAPRWTPVCEVEAAIVEKSSWILKQLHAARERQIHSANAAMVWQDGARLDYLGEAFTMHLGAMVSTIDEVKKCMWVALPGTAGESQVQEAVQSAIQRAALLLFEARLNHYAPLLGVRWTRLKLSNANGRWGSAKSDGSIRLNWRLMHYRLPVIDYVVVHELSHLRHMDHSSRFWDTVKSVMPDYAKLKKELKP